MEWNIDIVILDHCYPRTKIETYKCNYCETVSKGLCSYVHHKKAHQTEAGLRCLECDQNFEDEESLISHRELAHQNILTFTCETCHEIFFYEESLESHLYSDPASKIQWFCSICSESFPCKAVLAVHAEESHCEDSHSTPVLCPYCQTSFESSHELEKHVSKCGIDDDTDSPVDKKPKSPKKAVKRKKAEDNGPKKKRIRIRISRDKMCRYCRTEIGAPSEEALHKEHQVTTGRELWPLFEPDGPGEKQLRCDFCYEMFTSLALFHEHFLKAFCISKERLSTLACQGCDIVGFKHKKKLLYHAREHSWTCKICGKKFRQENRFYGHLNYHSGVQAFECEICCNKYFNSASLMRHRKVHNQIANAHREKPDYRWPCEICGKMVLKEKIQRHVLAHQGVKYPSQPNRRRCPCEICGKIVARNDLTSHIRRYHEGIKSKRENTTVACKVCSKRIKLGSLKSHMQLHKDEDNFPCELCGQSFKTEPTLRYHIRAQICAPIDNRSFPCKKCGREFKTWARLNYHTRVKCQPTKAAESDVKKEEEGAVSADEDPTLHVIDSC